MEPRPHRANVAHERDPACLALAARAGRKRGMAGTEDATFELVGDPAELARALRARRRLDAVDTNRSQAGAAASPATNRGGS